MLFDLQPVKLKLKKPKYAEKYGFTIATTDKNIHYARDIQKDGIADKHGLQDGDCILEINNVRVHKHLNNKNAMDIFKQYPKRVKLQVLKKSDYESKLQHYSVLEVQVNALKFELEAAKQLEHTLISENEKLRAENAKWQKQVFDLQTAQIDLETIKLEITSLLEDKELFETSNHDIHEVHLLTDNQIDEALASPNDSGFSESDDIDDLHQKINRLKVLLNIKKEQIKKLRNVVHSKEISTDSVLHSMKAKFEDINRQKDDVLAKYRAHKELLNLYKAKCTELQQQIETLKEIHEDLEESELLTSNDGDDEYENHEILNIDHQLHSGEVMTLKHKVEVHKRPEIRVPSFL